MATMRLGWFGKKHPSGASTFKPTVEDDDDESRHKGVDIDKDRDDIEKSMKSVSVVMPRNMEESLKQATTNTNAYYSKREGSNKSGQGGGAPSNTHSGDNDSIISLRRLRGTSTFAITSFIVALGCGVSGAFLGLGITSALKAQQDSFDRNAVDLVNKIRNAWADYVNAAAMIHGRCRNRDFSRRDFRELYEYLIGGGLDFQAAQYDPYVPLEERAFFEEVAKLYYQENFPHVEYNGFTGINYENSTIVEPRNEAEFYYPIHYMEPIWGNEAAIDLDYHASGSRRRTVLYCIDNGKPALTDRLRLVQEKEAIAYGVVLMHPGYNITTTGPGERWPYDLASIVIRIPDLLTRSTDKQSQGSDVYIFDKSDTSGNPLFLGGVRITPSAQEGSTADLQFLEEKLLEELRGPDGRLYREIDVQIANKVWTVSVLSRNDDFQADFVFVLVGGSIIFVATIGLAFWVHQNTKRVAKINRLKAEAEAEKASLILESARKAAEAERELNDFIAHEVRNPVAAAMSACSFVKAALNRKNPLSDEESQTTTREDVHIIDNALKFVNDLLRNMLDMHRAANKQLKVTLSPCDILHDVLEPVQAMLIQRGGKVDVEISCPDNMFAMADRLRLKQVMLNLGRNSAKFVDEGFIRLSAIPFEGDHVQIAVEDSGPGIPMEKKKLLFQKYQESLDMLSQGTGIGLFLCKNLVDLMDGHIYLDESFDSGLPGRRGTRFVVELRQPPEDFIPNTLDRYIDGYDGDRSVNSTDLVHMSRDLPESLSVLFVDDDPILRKLFSRTVKTVAPNWTIREAANGETALQLVETNHFDLIFMDMYMASVQKQLLGSETVAELRNRGITCRICGLSANDKEAEFVEAGADVFTFKPFPCEKGALRQELLRVLYAHTQHEHEHGHDNDSQHQQEQNREMTA